MLQLTIALIATFNLCLGYALGAAYGRQFDLPRLRRKKADEEPLVQTAAAATASQAQAGGRQTAASPQAGPVAAPAPTLAEPEAGPQPAEDDLASGLAAFQAQLAKMGEDLKNSQDDVQAFDANARNIQDANHAYLENAQQQIEKLPEEDKSRESAAAGVEEVGRISNEFDALVDEGLDSEQSRAKLVEKSGELTDKVTQVRDTQLEQERAARAEAAAAAGLATLDGLLEQIDAALVDGDGQQFRAAVLIRRDLGDAEQEPQAPAQAGQRLQAKVTELVRDSIPKAETVAALDDERLLVILEDGGIDVMIEAIDTLRQQIEKTTFVMEGQELNTTITCAVADLPGSGSHDEVMERLNEAMAESDRFGANRTFHHDGKFPTPAPPADADVQPQTVEVESEELIPA